MEEEIRQSRSPAPDSANTKVILTGGNFILRDNIYGDFSNSRRYVALRRNDFANKLFEFNSSELFELKFSLGGKVVSSKIIKERETHTHTTHSLQLAPVELSSFGPRSRCIRRKKARDRLGFRVSHELKTIPRRTSVREVFLRITPKETAVRRHF